MVKVRRGFDYWKADIGDVESEIIKLIKEKPGLKCWRIYGIDNAEI